MNNRNELIMQQAKIIKETLELCGKNVTDKRTAIFSSNDAILVATGSHTTSFGYNPTEKCMTRTLDGNESQIIIEKVDGFSVRYFPERRTVIFTIEYDEMKVQGSAYMQYMMNTTA